MGVKKCCHKFLVVFGLFWPSKWLLFKARPLFKTFFEKLESMTDLHILSDPVTDFWKCPKLFLGIFLSEPQKLNLNILNMAWWSIGNCRYTEFFSELKKKGFRGSLRSNFDKTIDQSNFKGFSWIFFH